MEDIDKIIGKSIKEVRKEKNISQEKLARMCDTSNTAISAYENGRAIPGLNTIARIAQVLEVSIERLIYGDEDNRFIEREPNVGKQVVNAVYLLWKYEVIKSEIDFEKK